MRLGFLVDGGESKALVPLKLLFLIHYAAFSTQTYLPIYFDVTEHFTKLQIGVLLSIPCICAILGPPIWGAAADILHNQKFIHIICLVSAALLMFSIRFVTSFEFMCIMVFLANFQTQPTMSLLDQTSMALLARVGGDYGKQRLYGAIGWGAGGYAAGVLAAAAGIAWCFNMVLALSCVSLFLLVKYIPSIQRKVTHNKGDFLQSLLLIFTQRDLIVLFVIVLLAGIMGGLIDNFLFLYLFNLSNNDANLVGVIIAVQTISELPLFFNANRIITHFGTPMCVVVSLIAYGIRLIVYVFVQHPWVALPIEVLHGLTYGLLWAAFTNYVYQSAPEGTEGTMIGVLTALQKGLGSGAGTLVGGYIYDHYGARAMWKVAGFGIFPCSLFFAMIFATVARNFTGQSPSRSHSNGALNKEGANLVANEELHSMNGYGTPVSDGQRKIDGVA
uniref:Major facilitator superfamily (MFS) profile domain-containing protein n=1 Tax=Globisporangium ultimum (strain ATCC 200006 / CBS 805.95 / DAOM BR144) TaxID=431595 RepID=K3W7D2_GLOUD